MTTEHCYLCRGEGYEVCNNIKSGAFCRCSRCGLVWLLHAHWPADQEKHYSEEYYPESYRGRENLARLFAYRFTPIKRYLKMGGRVLEIGAASGDFLHLLQGAGYEVAGVELSRRAASQARANYGLELSQGTLEEAHFPDAHFNAILMYHVLEHIPDPRAVLQEAYRTLAPGGRLLVEVPNVASIDAHLSSALVASILDYPHHLYAFTPRTLTRVVSDAGFRIVALEKSFPFALASAIARVRRLAHSSTAHASLAQESREVSGRELLARARPEPLVKRSIEHILPGMKMTLVAEKPSV